FVAACREAGIAPTEDYNVVSYEGVRYLEQTAHEGTRWSAARGYLRPARARPNLQVVTRALAHRVVFDGRRACGVEFSLPDGTPRRAEAHREVLLCAGAIQSPQLLELSGLGDPAVLAAHGIAVVQPLPAVGENMTDHLQVRRTYRTDVPITINDVMRSPLRRVATGLQYLLTRRGLMANTSSTAHAITRTAVADGRPDVMIRIYHISGKDRYSRSPGAGIDPFSGFSVGGFKLYPKSVGNLHIVSTDPRVPPRIQPNYFAHEEDRATAVALLRRIDDIARQPSFRPRIVEELRPGPACASDDELLAYAKECGQTAWHTVGTCRMGQGPEASVVDARLRVHGVAGLRVIDASVMPTIASSNTNAPAMMVGEKGADMILEEHGAR
nr:GMC oxidoreductase [Burkholderiaceae bacterium]